MTSAIGRAEHAARLDAARARMQTSGIDVLALSAGSDLEYLCGYEAMPLERITLLVVAADPAEPARLLVPELEAPRVDDLDALIEVVPWADGEDQYGRAVDLICADGASPGMVAVADRMWAEALLALESRLAGAGFTTASTITRALRIKKSERELAELRAAGAAIDTVVTALPGLDWAGRTEADLAGEIAALVIDVGHEQVNFVIVASGPNGASPHHTAGERVIGRGEVVVVDIGGKLNGYCSDTTRVVAVGEPPGEVVAAYTALRRAQEAAIAAVKPGVAAESVDLTARRILVDSGYGDYFIHRTGHGIGLDEHEDPYIVDGNSDVLDVGMCFSIEPGIYVPGRFGLRLEDIVSVASDGAEVMNTTPHDMLFAQ